MVDSKIVKISSSIKRKSSPVNWESLWIWLGCGSSWSISAASSAIVLVCCASAEDVWPRTSFRLLLLQWSAPRILSLARSLCPFSLCVQDQGSLSSFSTGYHCGWELFSIPLTVLTRCPSKNQNNYVILNNTVFSF